MKAMRKVLVYSPDPLDGLSFYRQWGPLSMMKGQVQCASFPARMEEIHHWTWYLNYDLIMMNRPNKMADLAFMNEAKKWGAKIWLDYDDDLLNIPEDNPVYETYSSETSRKVIEHAFQMADVITTPGPILKRWFDMKHPGKCRLLPNGLDDRLLPYAKPFQMSKRVAWRGSQSHLIDLLTYAEAIAGPLRDHPGRQVLFAGINPIPVSARIGKAAELLYAKPCNLIDFVRNYSNFHPTLQIVPLIKHRFNEVKSDLAWLDGTLVGAVSLCPSGEMWASDGMESYDFGDPNSFATEFNTLLGRTEGYLKKLWEISWDEIKSTRMVSQINKTRMEIIENL